MLRMFVLRMFEISEYGEELTLREIPPKSLEVVLNALLPDGRDLINTLNDFDNEDGEVTYDLLKNDEHIPGKKYILTNHINCKDEDIFNAYENINRIFYHKHDTIESIIADTFMDSESIDDFYNWLDTSGLDIIDLKIDPCINEDGTRNISISH